MSGLFGGGGIGSILAPLPKSIDPVGNATNKVLGFDKNEDKRRKIAAASQPAGTGLLTDQKQPTATQELGM